MLPELAFMMRGSWRGKLDRGFWLHHAGMQSAALGFLLAQTHFSDPLVAVPSAVSVVFMALGGSGLAVYWRNKPTMD